MSNQYPVNKSYGDKKDCRCGEHYHEKDCHDGGHHHHHQKVDCKPNKTIFKCRENCGTIIQATIPAAGAIETTPRTVGTITVRDLCCFKNPCVKLDISNIVTGVASAGVAVSLNYQISKRCENEENFRVIKNVTPIALGIGTTAATVPIAFSICDCEELCSSRECCCEYRVDVIANVTGAADETATITISSGTISVIAGDQNC